MRARKRDAASESLLREPHAVAEAALPEREDVCCPLCNRAPEPLRWTFKGSSSRAAPVGEGFVVARDPRRLEIEAVSSDKTV